MLIGNPNTDQEISYYSMLNAPLIRITNHKTASDFLVELDHQKQPARPMVAIELSSGSIDMWSPEAAQVLGHRNCILVLGA